MLRYKKYDIFLVSRGLSKVNIKKYESFLNDIPANLLEAFIKQKGFIYVVRRVKPFKPKIRGSTFQPKNDKIGYSIGLNHSEYNTLPHEFGHILDYLNDWASTLLEFEEIYLIEREIAQKELNYSDYHLKDATEYFAETFKLMLGYENTIKTTLPYTYNFIMQCLHNI